MAKGLFTVKIVPGLKRSDRRAVAFLSCEGVDHINAEMIFNSLQGKRLSEVQTRFDYWIDGGIEKRYFHGFNDSDHRHCFVFKWKEKTVCHRLYGFLFNPKVKCNPGFQACILCSHARKNEWETVPGELDGANELRNNPKVISAIKKTFPDSK